LLGNLVSRKANIYKKMIWQDGAIEIPADEGRWRKNKIILLLGLDIGRLHQ
jgi:hypothetical protein